MIKVEKLHYEVNRRLTRVNGEYNKNIKSVDIDAYLNHAIDIINENYTAIVERNITIGNHLRILEKKDVAISINRDEEKFTVFNLPQDHYSTLDVSAKGTTTDCGEEDDIFVHNNFSDSIKESLRSPNWNPNFNWRETFYDEFDNSVAIYHDGKLIVTKAYMSYISTLPHVACVTCAKGNYITPEGYTITSNKDFLIDNTAIWRKVCDLALMLIRRDFEENFNADVSLILFTEKAYLQ